MAEKPICSDFDERLRRLQILLAEANGDNEIQEKHEKD
jgi:hypothetical protein